jgi:hypothetical protein
MKNRANYRIFCQITFLLAATALVVLLSLLVAGCGEEAAPVAETQTVTETRTTIGSSPEDTGRLMTAASEALQALSRQSLGVHFTLESTIGGTHGSFFASGEGDMAFPDRVNLNMRQIIPGNQPVEAELIMILGTVYTKSQSTGGIWRTTDGGFIPPDPMSIKEYMDFARSSRNFGQESLLGGRKTIHIQVDVDTVLEAEEARKRTDDPAMLQTLEDLKNSAVTVDFWIGVDDFLIYQQITKVTESSGSASETRFVYSNWGRPVDIQPPCEEC